MPLRELQCAMQHYLLGGESRIGSAIVEAPPLAAVQRLGIYRNAYRIRLIEALDDTYPSLHKVLGDEVFAALGEAFIAAHPSVHRSIRWYGREMSRFLAHRSPYAGQPILAELALFEWTLSEVFDAPDAVAPQHTALQTLNPDAWAELEFRFHPSVRRLNLAWNTVAVWQAISHDTAPPQPQPALEPVQWLLWRRDFQNFFRTIDTIEGLALDAALRGENFGRICEALRECLPEEQIPLRAAHLVSTWTDSGLA